MYEAFKDIIAEIAEIPGELVPIVGDIANLA